VSERQRRGGAEGDLIVATDISPCADDLGHGAVVAVKRREHERSSSVLSNRDRDINSTTGGGKG
jgi:hypothetical protein